jgi:hypothetical protein
MDSERGDQGARQRQSSVIVDHPLRGPAAGNREKCRKQVEKKAPVAEAVICVDHNAPW